MVRRIKTDAEIEALMPKKKSTAADDIDLGIMDGASAQPTMAEKLYAERIASGLAPEPDDDDPSFTPGVRQALASAENSNTTPSVATEDSKPLPVAVLEMSAAEHGLAEYLEVDLAASAEVLAARVKEDAGHLLVTEIRMGLRLIAMKAKVDHGEFEELLARIGIPERAAQKAMQTSRAFASVGDARRREQILALGKTKGVALLLTNPDVRDQILDDPELAQEAMEGSKLELQRLLKEKETLIERKDKAYGELEARLDEKTLELRKLSRIDPVALITRSARAEAVADAAAVGECCDSLLRLWNTACTDDAADDASLELRQRGVALSISACMAQVQALYDRVKADLNGIGITLPLSLGVNDDLTSAERVDAASCLERVRLQFLVRKESRAKEAYDEHVADGGQKKRGRPANSKTVSV